MAGLSGYDSDATGFESISRIKKVASDSGTQTNFSESGTSSQTNLSQDMGCTASPEDLNAEDDILREYPPPGLNEFLKRVVPGVLEQLDNNDKDCVYNSSDSDEEDTINAKLFQEIAVKADMPALGGGDFQASILGVTWSSAGNSVAVSIGHLQHETWCQHDGLIRVYTVKRSDQDHLVHSLDITEKNCISVLQYHPSVSALLAYGTTSGEVVLCNLRTVDASSQLSSPAGCHGSTRVTHLAWADAPLANMFLVMQINKTGKRRGAADQVLISSGSDGTLNVWQVNMMGRVFESVVCYRVNCSRQSAAPDVTCFDFIKCCPLRPSNQKVPEDIFVVGTKTGQLFLCKVKSEDLVDPVYDVLEGHNTCVLDVAFSFQRPGVFASISMDSELRIYDVNQNCPLKVLCIEVPISCMSWVPNNPCLVILGLNKPERHLLQVYNASSARMVAMEGFKTQAGAGSITAMSVSQHGSCRVAAGDSEGVLRIWDMPSRSVRLSAEDLDF